MPGRYRAVPAAAKYAELERLGLERKLCWCEGCNGEPMLWSAHADRSAGGRWRCATKQRRRSAAYYAANADRVRASQAAYYAAYYAAHQEERNAYSREWRAANAHRRIRVGGSSVYL